MKKIIKQEQWVMLPIENYSDIVHSTSKYGGLFLSRHYSPMKDMGDSYQHLYLTSDEEIKEGDWVIYQTASKSWRMYGKCNKEKVQSANKDVDYYKIIATTDKSLKIDTNLEDRVDVLYDNKLPQIPESFIKYYVEKQGKVGDVELEYNDRYLGYACGNTILTVGEHSQEIEGTAKDTRVFSLNLTDNNEIIIDIPKEEEKMYSRDEVEELIRRSCSDMMLYSLDNFSGKRLIMNEWIKENL